MHNINTKYYEFKLVLNYFHNIMKKMGIGYEKSKNLPPDFFFPTQAMQAIFDNRNTKIVVRNC